MKILKSAFSKYSSSKKTLKSAIIIFIGLAAFIWFLIRVIPKPSRAAYPCMQAAFPFATAFLIWFTGILTSSLLFVNAKAKWRRSKYILASVLLFLAAFVFILTSTSIKYTPVIARAYIFTSSLLGNPLPEMQSIFAEDGSILIVEPVAFVGAVKSSKIFAQEIDSSEIVSMVSLAIERAGGLEGIVSDGDTVILKPNLVSPMDGTANPTQLNPEVNGITTDYRVVQAVVNIVRDINPNGVIYVMEGSAAGNTAANMAMLNYNQIVGIDGLICLEDACGAWGDTTSVYLKLVSLAPDKVLYNGANNRYWLNKLYHDADVVISMPVMKNHCYTGATGSVKNVGIGATPPTIYGISPSNILRWNIDHENPPRTNLHYFIHDFFMCRPVDFVVVDGLQSIQNGPVSYDSTSLLSFDQMNMRLILACKDPIAVDAVNSLLTGHDPELIPHLVTLHNDSMGCCDSRLIRVNGIKVGDEKKDFEIYDTGELSKYDDFAGPGFSINEIYVVENQLHLSLSVDEEVTKVEVSIDSIYLNQIVINDFDNNAFDLDTLEVNPDTKIIVYVYDKYLNYSKQDTIGIIHVSLSDNNLPEGGIAVYPNPCSHSTHLRFTIVEQQRTICDLYQMSGMKLRRLLDEVKMPGEYEMEIDVSDLPSGTYFLILQAGEQVRMKKVIVK